MDGPQQKYCRSFSHGFHCVDWLNLVVDNPAKRGHSRESFDGGAERNLLSTSFAKLHRPVSQNAGSSRSQRPSLTFPAPVARSWSPKIPLFVRFPCPSFSLATHRRMSNPNGFRTVLLLTPPLFLLLPISVLAFVLERITQALLLAQTLRSWRNGAQEITVYGPTANSTDPSDYDYTDVSLGINYAPTAAILGVSVVAFVVSILGVCGIWELRRMEGSARTQRVWSWLLLVAHVAVVGLSVGVLAYASALQGSEKSWKSYADVGKEGQRFTRETWVCQIDEFYPKQDWARPACGLAVCFIVFSTWHLDRC